MLELDLVQTVAFAGVMLLVGLGIRKRVPLIGRYNIPVPVLSGLLVAVAILIGRNFGDIPLQFDTTLQSHLMLGFFASIGFVASVPLLYRGGPQVMIFLAVATVFAVLQNLLGVGVALAFGLNPLFGVLTGSVTLTGGPATGLAFAPQFEAAGVPAAAALAVAAAMAGIVLGGLVGGPVGTYLIERFKLKPESTVPPTVASTVVTTEIAKPEPVGEDDDPEVLAALKSVILILIAMWAATWVIKGASAIGVTLPVNVGGMLCGAAIRNFDDYTGLIKVPHRVVEVIGAVALSLFLVLALMTLRLWELAALAAPLILNLFLQTLLVVVACRWLVFRVMGRDYEAAVMSGGFIGFMLGTTANAMAVMSTLTARYGAAPRAFLVTPTVGAFFIDFTNALLITAFLNMFS